jgi:hypothetical protein
MDRCFVALNPRSSSPGGELGLLLLAEPLTGYFPRGVAIVRFAAGDEAHALLGCTYPVSVAIRLKHQPKLYSLVQLHCPEWLACVLSHNTAPAARAALLLNAHIYVSEPEPRIEVTKVLVA